MGVKINIFTKNISLDNPLEVFVNDKIGGLEKFLKSFEPVNAKVEIGIPSKHHRSGNIFYAEANLHTKDGLFRAQAQAHDLRDAIVEVKNELQIQIRRYKDKGLAKRHQ